MYALKFAINTLVSSIDHLPLAYLQLEILYFKKCQVTYLLSFVFVRSVGIDSDSNKDENESDEGLNEIHLCQRKWCGFITSNEYNKINKHSRMQNEIKNKITNKNK